MDGAKLFFSNRLSTFGGLVMSNRRSFLASVGGSVAAAYTPLASSQVMCELSLPTSPRSTSVRPRVRDDALERGAQSSHDVAEAIHRNFQESIERNFARLAPGDTVELVGKLSDRELSLLSQLYAVASLNSGRLAKLLPTLVPKINPRTAARLARHFGTEQVYAEALKISPTAGGILLREVDGFKPFVPDARILVNENPLDYTIREIYLNFRTAPKGSFSVPAAMYETATYAGTRLIASFGAGYALGTAVQRTWEYVSPDSWGRFSDFLGSRVDRFLNATLSIVGSIPWDSITNQMSKSAGYWQGVLWEDFEKPGDSGWFSNGGGDFGVTDAWYDYKHAHPACQW
jgi:hypothetical protein